MSEVRKINHGREAVFAEAYLGEYASGKSEIAVNRAVELASIKRKVTLVDLDLVEPFYTLRPLKRSLQEEHGIDVVAWETKDTLGLGEAGSILKPEMKWVLRRKGDIILDVGYGVEGARALNLVEGAWENPYLRIYLVVNVARPMTSSLEDILLYAKNIGRVDALINNSHLGDETDTSIVQAGAKLVTAAAQALGVDVCATTVVAEVAAQLGNFDCMGNRIKVINRYMPGAFW